MSLLEVTLDKRTLEAIEKTLEEAPETLKKASVFSINRTMEQVKTKAVKRATEKYTVKRKDLTNSTRFYRANYSNLNAKFISSGKVLGLDHFKLYPRTRPRKTKRIQVEIKRGQRKNLGKRAFIAYKSGFLGAFERTSSRPLPIKRLMGPSAPQMIGNEELLEELEGFMEEKINERFLHELGRLL